MRIPTLHANLQTSQDAHHHTARFAESAVHTLSSVTRTVLRRDSSDSETCPEGDHSARCQTPSSVQSSQNLAIILGVVIPLSCAVIVLIYLHRRHMKRQRLEDINDPHKSLDFGMAGVEPIVSKRNRGKKGPEMRATDIGAASSKRNHGLSMDLGMHIDSPYIIPPGLNGSHESLHSMSRSMRDEHDPYRPVTHLRRPSTDNDSLRFGRLNDDKGSLYSMSTGQHSALQDKASLVANARPMSQSNFSRRIDPTSPADSSSSDEAPRAMHSAMNANTTLDRNIPEIVEEKSLPSPPPSAQSFERQNLPVRGSSVSAGSYPSQKELMPMSDDQRPESSNYGDEEPSVPVRVTIHEPEPDSESLPYDINPAAIHTGYAVENPLPPPVPMLQAPPKTQMAGQRLSVMGVRPLPPDVPDDNPEIRANRIRSFYKEYFDDSKPNPAQGHYEEDDIYGAYMDGVVYDPETGGFFAPSKPFAQGPGRRAMTPPPRARPRVSGNSGGGPHQRKYSTYSTMSAGRPRGRSLPKKKLPPPKALTDLPTPHLMKDDAAIFNAADFAPPTTFRNMQNGSRPGSPMGLQRPYSPSVRAFTPLASSFDSLAVLPSPHDLRKSGTFTALDFAPPSKIRDPMLSPSDAGSIRSNRSGMSAMQMHAVREGAYRVSRIPQELVTTSTNLTTQLKPKMNMTTAA